MFTLRFANDCLLLLSVSKWKNELTYVGISGKIRSVLTFAMNWGWIVCYLFSRSFHSYGRAEEMIGAATIAATLMPCPLPLSLLLLIQQCAG
jgi:hypothetical protein